MAENDGRDRAEPTLELPSFLRRRRRSTTAAPAEPAQPPARSRASRASMPSLPSPTASVAAAATGLVVGLAGVLLVYLGLRGCDGLRGASSCGEGTGLALILVIFLAMAALGAVLLSLWQVPEPRSSSILAVGATTVVALLVLNDALFSTWMVLVLPALTSAAYAGAHWLATRRLD